MVFPAFITVESFKYVKVKFMDCQHWDEILWIHFFGTMYSTSKLLSNLNIIYKDFLIFPSISLVLKCVKANILHSASKHWD